MQVKFLAATDYEPQPMDSPRCYGQLQLRVSESVREIDLGDGKIELRRECGPVVTYFPAGSVTDLRDDVALAFIAGGVAELLSGPVVEFVTKAEILKDVKVDP